MESVSFSKILLVRDRSWKNIYITKIVLQSCSNEHITIAGYAIYDGKKKCRRATLSNASPCTRDLTYARYVDICLYIFLLHTFLCDSVRREDSYTLHLYVCTYLSVDGKRGGGSNTKMWSEGERQRVCV